MILANSSSYAGATTLAAGTLQLASISAAGTAPGMIAQFHLDGSFGAIADGATIVDSLGGHNGTMNGAAASYVPGKFGQAASFTGSQNIQIPYSSSFNLSTFSVSAWSILRRSPQPRRAMASSAPAWATIIRST